MVILMPLVTLILNPPRDRMYWTKPHSDDWFQTADNHFTQGTMVRELSCHERCVHDHSQ